VTRALVIDDEPQIVRALRINLTARGYQVLTAADGAGALRAAADVMVLDLGLPDLDGTEVIAGLRGWTSVPIIVLSARTDSTDKVQALDAGADDYVTKPFGMDELLARLRAAVRRSAVEPGADEPVIATDAFTIDRAAKKVHRGNVEVHLTPTEWGILEMLVCHSGRLVTQRQLLTEVWVPHTSRNPLSPVYLAQLRRKLEPDPSRPRYFVTEPGWATASNRRQPFKYRQLRPRVPQTAANLAHCSVASPEERHHAA
jgi:two-component system, OmpR family, KDP operon response regulator KdpE